MLLLHVHHHNILEVLCKRITESFSTFQCVLHQTSTNDAIEILIHLRAREELATLTERARIASTDRLLNALLICMCREPCGVIDVLLGLADLLVVVLSEPREDICLSHASSSVDARGILKCSLQFSSLSGRYATSLSSLREKVNQ